LKKSEIDDVFVNGEKYKIIPINKLLELKDEVDHFKQDNKLTSFQNWIVNDLYRFDIPRVEFSIRSIIIIAIPHPFYAEVVLTKNKKKYHCISLVMSDFEKTENVLNQILFQRKIFR
jgi:epoxyqueuosine reductase